jgi:microcystin-dependent protein
VGSPIRKEQIKFSTALPVGVIMFYGDAAVPAGWLECDGSAVSETTYADLFAVIGYTFGNPGGGNFNLPDLRGRALQGDGTGDASDATAHTIGDKDGTEGVTLSESQIPSHNHGFAGIDGAVVQNGAGGQDFAGGPNAYVLDSTTQSTGGGSSHPNYQPTLTAVGIIFAGV